jgi:hypothetical protein
MASFGEHDSDLDDPEAPDPSDIDPDIDDDTEPCPHCSRLIHELSDFCPHCGQYTTLQERPMRKRWWIVLGVGACLIIVVLWLAQSV